MKILERLRNINSLRIRVFVPLILALMLLIGSMALILRQSQQKVLGLELAAKTKETERLFHEYKNEEAKTLSLTLSTLSHNKELMAAFKAKDRKRLHDMMSPCFEQMRSHYDITHLYFTGPDRVNILRVHQPDRYGDRIDRFTTLEAEKTGKESWGIEFGPMGTFTLRAVTPWYDGGKLLGYVELGMEVEHILKELQGILASRVYVFLHKDFIQREGWEAGIRMLGHKEEWGHFPDTIIAGEPLDQIPENVAQVMAGKHARQPGTDIHINGTYYRVAFTPLMDAGQRKIGHIAILLDTTARVSAFQRSVLFISSFYVLVGAALVVFFYVFLGQIEKKQKRMEEARFEFEQKFRIIFDNANDGILLADIETRKFFLGNEMICRMLGYGPEEIKTLGVADIHPAKDLPRVIDQFERQQRREFTIAENLPVQRKDGSIFYADISSYPITLGGKNYLVGFFRDITQRKRNEEEIYLLATTDSLTGIANRREFAAILAREMEQTKRYGTPMALAMYDLDYFKQVNDTFGHDVGDYVLQAVTGLVKENIRASDIVARWGGEEFMVLMPQTDIQAAGNTVEKLRLAVAGHRFDKVNKLTVSFGVTALEPQDDINSLLKRVDDALYQAKEQGRNRVEILSGAVAAH